MQYGQFDVHFDNYNEDLDHHTHFFDSVRAGKPVVEDPVFGILIRNRVGVSVYGTNTELEDLHFGPVAAGDEIELRFAFGCALCPQEYTLTLASHHPDGTAHDWLEEALLFTVSDSRFTEGVANLRAQVSVSRG